MYILLYTNPSTIGTVSNTCAASAFWLEDDVKTITTGIRPAMYILYKCFFSSLQNLNRIASNYLL